MTEKIKNIHKKDTTYDYVGTPFYKGDKDELIQALNDAEAPYTSLAHFVRCAVNTELSKLKINFGILK